MNSEPTAALADRPYYLFDEQGVAIPHEEPYEELADANARAKALARRVIVVKRLPDGTFVHMSYTGPGGWMGPNRKPPPHPAYGPSPRYRTPQGNT